MSREAMLERIRRSLNRNGPVAPGVAEALATRLAAPPVHVLPAFEEDPVARFVARVELVAGSVARAASAAGISRAVLAYLKANELPLDIVRAEDPLLEGVRWSNQLAVKQGLPGTHDRVSVTVAYAGIAETGTVVMLSAPCSPTTLNFLPEHHLVVLRRASIVRHPEAVWTRLRQEFSDLPRTVNFITGPSRTGDVEQVLALGAHGPRCLHVILVGKS